MQRMSDLLTQLVTRTTNTDTQESEPMNSTETTPIVQSPTSPPSTQSPTTVTNDDEEPESDVNCKQSNSSLHFSSSVLEFSIFSSVEIKVSVQMMMTMMMIVWMVTMQMMIM